MNGETDSFESSFWENTVSYGKGPFDWHLGVMMERECQQKSSGYSSWKAAGHLIKINFIFVSLETEMSSLRKQRCEECYLQMPLFLPLFKVIIKQTYEEHVFSGMPNNSPSQRDCSTGIFYGGKINLWSI